MQIIVTLIGISSMLIKFKKQYYVVHKNKIYIFAT